YESDVALCERKGFWHAITEDFDRAPILTYQAHENADGRRLACTVCADESHNASGRKFEIDVGQGKMAVVFSYACKANGERLAHAISSRCLCAAWRICTASSFGENPSSVPTRAAWSMC